MCYTVFMKSKKDHLSVGVSEYAIKRLRFHASRLGFVSERGSSVGTPSISQLLEAIADGSVRLVKESPSLDKKGLHP